jgi:hypothetical protein
MNVDWELINIVIRMVPREVFPLSREGNGLNNKLQAFFNKIFNHNYKEASNARNKSCTR